MCRSLRLLTTKLAGRSQSPPQRQHLPTAPVNGLQQTLAATALHRESDRGQSKSQRFKSGPVLDLVPRARRTPHRIFTWEVDGLDSTSGRSTRPVKRKILRFFSRANAVPPFHQSEPGWTFLRPLISNQINGNCKKKKRKRPPRASIVHPC